MAKDVYEFAFFKYGLPSNNTYKCPTLSSESNGDIIEYDAISPSRQRTSGERVSQSLDLTLNQINRALCSFKVINSEEYLKLKEQNAPKDTSQESRMTDSYIMLNRPKKLNKGRGRP